MRKLDATLTEWQNNIKDLPDNWTVDDIEARMPEKMKQDVRTYRLTLVVHNNRDEDVESEWFVNLNYHEKVDIVAKLDTLKTSGRLLSYKFRSEPLLKKKFVDSIINVLLER
jgi:hypothetical protein